jgi:hypothetical protein
MRALALMHDHLRRSRRMLIGLSAMAFGFSSPATAQIPREQVAHVLRRVTFGPTPTQLETITTQAQLDAYLNDQLTLPGIGYSAGAAPWMAKFPAEPLDASNYGTHGWSEQDLQNKQLVLALTSDWQLREVMTLFWENHFSTSLQIVAVGITGTQAEKVKKATNLEWRENSSFREHALGTFKDLLRSSMNSSAMRYYLNADQNCAHPARATNENYARELLELHTLGPGPVTAPNYVYDDILEVMGTLAGIDVAPDGDIASTALCTDIARRTIFANTPVPTLLIWPPGTQIPADPIVALQAQVQKLRDHLVAAPQTKEFVCTKLIRYFVGDHQDPVDPALLAACVAAWDQGAGDGDIEQILQTIFASTLFQTPSPDWTRVELPVETVVSQARILEGRLGDPATTTFAQMTDRLTALRKVLAATGALPFTYPSPDGYPYASVRQIGTAVTWSVGEYAYGHYANAASAFDLVYDPVPMLQYQVQTVFGGNFAVSLDVASTALSLVAPSRYSWKDLGEADAFLNPGGPGTWSPTAPDVDERVRLLFAFASTLPQAMEK